MPFPRRFSDDDIRTIRQSPRSARDLARDYEVTHATILNIRERRTYKHVPDHLGAELNNTYFIAEALPFLKQLPDGYCETVIMAHRVGVKEFSVRSLRDDPTDRTPSRSFFGSPRLVIQECSRVAGQSGVVLYLHSFMRRYPRGMNVHSNLTWGLPLKQVIIVNYPTTEHFGFSRPGRRMTMLPHTYDVIFMFAGPHWSVPEDTLAAAARWGDVWDFESQDPLARPSRSAYTPQFSEELAYRCVALGRGRVLAPYAGAGNVILAAINAGRDWLACDTDEALLNEFEDRVSDFQRPTYRLL